MKYCVYVCVLSRCSSVQFSHSVVSDSLRPHESQHARPPCPSPTPRVHPNSCPSSQWCHPAISSSVVPFSCPQSLPASESFPMSQLFTWGGQSIGVSALVSVLPKNTQDWLISLRMDWLDLLAVQGTLKSLLQLHSSKASILRRSAFFTVQLSHPYMTTRTTIALTRWTFVGKVMSLQSCPTLCDPVGCRPQAPLSVEFSRQEYWSGLHSLLQRIFPTQGSNPRLLCLLHWQAGSLPLAPPGKPTMKYIQW